MIAASDLVRPASVTPPRFLPPGARRHHSCKANPCPASGGVNVESADRCSPLSLTRGLTMGLGACRCAKAVRASRRILPPPLPRLSAAQDTAPSLRRSTSGATSPTRSNSCLPRSMRTTHASVPASGPSSDPSSGHHRSTRTCVNPRVGRHDGASVYWSDSLRCACMHAHHPLEHLPHLGKGGFSSARVGPTNQWRRSSFARNEFTRPGRC